MWTVGRSGVSFYLRPLNEAITVLTLDQITGVLMETAVVDKEVFFQERSWTEDTFENLQRRLTNLQVIQAGRARLRMKDFQKLRNHR